MKNMGRVAVHGQSDASYIFYKNYLYIIFHSDASYLLIITYVIHIFTKE